MMDNNMILADISETLKGIKNDLDILVNADKEETEESEDKNIEELIKDIMNDYGIKGNVVIKEIITKG